MTKIAYLVISDLHFSGSAKPNRYDYSGEILFVVRKVIDVIRSVKERGFSVGIVFLGDIFDRSYSSPTKFGVDSSALESIIVKADLEVFSVVGNHETSYWVNNPFWTLVNSVESERLVGMRKKNVQPLGYVGKIRIVDCFEVGDCVFHFNHFGCSDSAPVLGRKNIAFCHKPVADKNFLDGVTCFDFGSVESEKAFEFGLGRILEYDCSFVGHIHDMYGRTVVGNSQVWYLASLGRPHKDTVDDGFLERNIPVILFEEGKLVGVEDNVFELMGRDECVVPEVDEKEKEKYEVKKAVENAKEYSGAFDNPMDNVKAFFGSEPLALFVLSKLSDGSVSDIVLEIGDQISNIRARRIRGD
jgi:hypothetical protein